MSNRKKIAAGNWKMNSRVSDVVDYLSKIDDSSIPADVEMVLCAPFTHLHKMIELTETRTIKVGAQDVSSHDKGAFTGEISADMLCGLGVDYIIVGHSERREYHQESDEMLLEKIKACLYHSITPIFCCGEPLEKRNAGEYITHVIDQLEAVLMHLDPSELSQLVIAYEPIWAIGTGETASPDQAQEMHEAIRNFIKNKFSAALADSMPILYGGSVKPANAKELFGQPDVDGGLVGGASLDPSGFVEIANSF